MSLVVFPTSMCVTPSPHPCPYSNSSPPPCPLPFMNPYPRQSLNVHLLPHPVRRLPLVTLPSPLLTSCLVLAPPPCRLLMPPLYCHCGCLIVSGTCLPVCLFPLTLYPVVIISDLDSLFSSSVVDFSSLASRSRPSPRWECYWNASSILSFVFIYTFYLFSSTILRLLCARFCLSIFVVYISYIIYCKVFLSAFLRK